MIQQGEFRKVVQSYAENGGRLQSLVRLYGCFTEGGVSGPQAVLLHKLHKHGSMGDRSKISLYMAHWLRDYGFLTLPSHALNIADAFGVFIRDNRVGYWIDDTNFVGYQFE